MSYFDKFIKDLEDRRQRKKDSKTILEQEQQYQERRRERALYERRMLCAMPGEHSQGYV